MMAGGDSSGVCVVGKHFSQYQDAISCKEELENKNQKPYHVSSNRVVKGYVTACRINVVYGGETEKNYDFAKQCAVSLTILTGTKHEARFPRNGVFVGTYTVVRLKQ